MYDSEEKQPKWMVFDLEWYRNRYKSFSLLIQDIYQGDVFAYHSTNGYKVGNSPNPYFDEKWYLTKYYDVKELIKKGKYTSGFDHYCKIGFKDHSPHWLFSETFYKKHNPEINDRLARENLILMVMIIIYGLEINPALQEVFFSIPVCIYPKKRI